MAGIGIGRRDRSGDPVAVDTERAAAGGADRRLPGDRRTLRPGLAAIDRLPDVRLQGHNVQAAVQVAQIHGAGLVRGQTVVAAAGVGSLDLRPARSVVRRPIGDRAAAWRADVEPARVVGHDRRLAAVRPDVGDRVARRRCAKDARRQPDRGRDHGSNAGSSQQGMTRVLHFPHPRLSRGLRPRSRQTTYQGKGVRGKFAPHRQATRASTSSITIAGLGRRTATIAATNPATAISPPS